MFRSSEVPYLIHSIKVKHKVHLDRKSSYRRSESSFWNKFLTSDYITASTITYLRRCLDNDIFLRFIQNFKSWLHWSIKVSFYIHNSCIVEYFWWGDKKLFNVYFIVFYSIIKKSCGQFPVNGTSSTWDHYHPEMLKNVKLTFCLRFKTTSDYFIFNIWFDYYRL